jgi:nicotinamide mononucleotide adenylyltransferase
LLKIKDALIV